MSDLRLARLLWPFTNVKAKAKREGNKTADKLVREDINALATNIGLGEIPHW